MRSLFLSAFIVVCLYFSTPNVHAHETQAQETQAQETQAQGTADSTQRPNVLFIAVDDLRPQLNCYGKQFMKTPNFDALARRSVLFERAYCMVPTCGASRASLMTSLRPKPNRFTSHLTRADKDAPNAITLNTLLKNAGYTTISLGKIFHDPQDSVAGWSQPPWRAKGSDYSSQAMVRDAVARHKTTYGKQVKKDVRGPAVESADLPGEHYRDHQTASKTIEHLGSFAQRSAEPFFLACGFVKPHLPFCAPQKYWDLYEADSIIIPDNYSLPENVPDRAAHSSGELRSYAGIPPTGPVDRATARQLIHGYYACVSFIDAQLGRVLMALDESGLADNTIIVLWGDHGWQLGEHGMWNKHSCFETSMHTPLMIAAPGVTGGVRTAALTEFIDVYPTLCELTGTAIPDHVEGASLAPLLRDPSLPGKPYAVGRYQSGDTIRSDHYRFSQYRNKNGAGAVNGSMLYDHRVDDQENNNLADEAAAQSTAKLLARELNTRKGK